MVTFSDFGATPPEITSARLYSGSGSGSTHAAAAAWDRLAAELQATAASYHAIVSGLSAAAWRGPASDAMTAAALPYISWLSATATQAKETAGQARAAAAAFEETLAAAVPPPVIAANRSRRAELVAGNLLGQHTAAIAALETQYAQMWSQDAAAMFGYAGSASAATRVTPFVTPPQTTTAAASGGGDAPSSLEGMLHVIPQLLQNLSSFVSQYSKGWENMLDSVPGVPWVSTLWEDVNNLGTSIGGNSIWANTSASTVNFGIGQWKTFFHPPVGVTIPKSALGAGLGGAAGRSAVGGVGEASVVGRLSVPPSWAAATPAIRMASTMLPGTAVAAAPVSSLPASLLTPLALGSMSGGAIGAAAPRVAPGTRIVRQATAGTKQRAAPVDLDGVIAELTEQPSAVQHWYADPAELEKVLAELSLKPGIHTVHLTAEPPAAHLTR